MKERREIAVRGIVQGVGFRPFVHRLAERWRLVGSVRNHAGAVLIAVEGSSQSLDGFLSDLTSEAPPLASIRNLQWVPARPKGESQFRIESSTSSSSSDIFVSPDIATCDDCLRELFDPNDRRYGYPFLNCTNCGPRLTMINAAPFDRARTTMALFAMCTACQAEYDDPADRRFHAEATCCPDCGPRLQMVGPTGAAIASGDPVAAIAAALTAGRICAIKGIGGYHLACDARSSAAVAQLRRRKQRDEKPFALMVRSDVDVELTCNLDEKERQLLRSPRRPIVLLRKRVPCPVADEVAPGNPFLGIMLPCAPVQHLLFHALGGTPLVMTSGNRSDEPIAIDDEDALSRLADVADLFLIHDRPIRVRCDDSVTRLVDDTELLLRRSRGHAPEPLTLPFSCSPPTLAVGGQFKGAFALANGMQAIVSHHLGDLDYYAAFHAFSNDIALYEELFALRPARIVHDLHPEYASTRYAQARAQRDGVQLLAVQHHHAHMASCMAEHGLAEPVIGVSFDGTGYGADGAIWGGEFLIGDYRRFRRAGHLRYVAMPGGATAIRNPWCMALTHLLDAGETDALLRRRIAATTLRATRQILERGVHSPMTSSAGRLFDAVAALAGVRDRVSFEGQAAMQLEWLATDAAPEVAYEWDITESGNGLDNEGALVIDTRSIIRGVVADAMRLTPPAQIARRFHTTMAELIARVCERLRQATGLCAVVLSGGVFMNALLTREATRRLTDVGFRVYRHQRVPPNDGGLSLGQLAIAAAQQS
jgi:hydrogenase maturation protein HypF